MPNDSDNTAGSDCPSTPCSPSSLTPATDQIFQLIDRACAWETDRVHSQAAMEAARNEVERMETQLQRALRKLEQLKKERDDAIGQLAMGEENMGHAYDVLREEMDALRIAGLEIIVAVRHSLTRPHPTVERNAKLFIRENE